MNSLGINGKTERGYIIGSLCLVYKLRVQRFMIL